MQTFFFTVREIPPQLSRREHFDLRDRK